MLQFYLCTLIILHVQKFMHDPVTATMGGFSRVTNFLRDNLMVPDHSSRPTEEVAEILSEDLPGIAIDNQEEPGFEMVTTVSVFVIHGCLRIEL